MPSWLIPVINEMFSVPWNQLSVVLVLVAVLGMFAFAMVKGLVVPGIFYRHAVAEWEKAATRAERADDRADQAHERADRAMELLERTTRVSGTDRAGRAS